MKCPVWLTAEAKKLWRRLVPQLERAGLVKEVDETGMAVLCQQIARWRQAEETLDRDKLFLMGADGLPKLHPAARYADAVLKQIKALLVQFGFTPRSRGERGSSSGPDDLDRFLNDPAITSG